MEKSIEELSCEQRIVEIVKLLDCKIIFEEAEDRRAVPVFSFDEVISKLIALLIFMGAHIPSYFSPAYNRVHADVEFWKNKKEGIVRMNQTD